MPMKVWMLFARTFDYTDIWDVYQNVEDGKKDTSLPNDIQPWQFYPTKGKWVTSSDLTWYSYELEEHEIK